MYAAPATPPETPSPAKTAARARAGLAYLALEVCGYTGSAVAALLGVRPSAVYRAAQRGQASRGRWERQLNVFSEHRAELPGEVFCLFTIKCQPVADVIGVQPKQAVGIFL